MDDMGQTPARCHAPVDMDEDERDMDEDERDMDERDIDDMDDGAINEWNRGILEDATRAIDAMCTINERNLPINSNEEPLSWNFQPPTILNLMGAGPDEDPTGALRVGDIPRLMADALLENLRDRQASNRTLPSATPNSRRRQADATLPSVRGAHLRPQEVRGYQEDDAHRTYGNCRDPTCRLELERGLLGECQCGDMVGECGLPVCRSEAAGLRAAPCPHASLPPAGPSCRAAPPRRTAAAERS
jgi:hypothetical protein